MDATATPVSARLDAALAKAAGNDLDLRAIYLSPEDAFDLDLELGAAPETYRDIPLRRGKKTIAYSTRGVNIHVPVRAP